MQLSYKYRLYPNRAQIDGPWGMPRDFCALYSAARQQRIEAYNRWHVLLGYPQGNDLKPVRGVKYGFERWSFSAEQQALRRLDKAFKAFVRRMKTGDSFAAIS